MHRCPTPGCEQRVPDRLFMCRPHWYRVPRELRDEVWRCYRRFGVGSPELALAHNAALATLEQGAQR